MSSIFLYLTGLCFFFLSGGFVRLIMSFNAVFLKPVLGDPQSVCVFAPSQLPESMWTGLVIPKNWFEKHCFNQHQCLYKCLTFDLCPPSGSLGTISLQAMFRRRFSLCEWHPVPERFLLLESSPLPSLGKEKKNHKPPLGAG